MKALRIYAGSRALQHLREQGLRPQDVQTIPAAAGGPKGLILGPLDRFIFGEWLPQSNQTVHLVGASIGAWRMATACLQDSPAAFERLEHDYIHQHYELLPGQKRPTADFVSERFGESLQADMVALPVGAPQRFCVVASPDYLAHHGAPAEPAQLTAHACINLRFPSGRLYAWQFARGGRAFDVQVQGSFTANDQTALLQAAEAGLGVAYVYAGHAVPLIAQGRLAAVLDDWLPPAEQLYLYYPSRRLQPAGFQALLDAVKAAVD